MGDVIRMHIKLYHATVTNRSGSMSLASGRFTNKMAAKAYFEHEYPHAQKIDVRLDPNEEVNDG